MDSKRLITDFLAYLENKKKRNWRTVRNYDFYLKKFLLWAENNDLDELDKLTTEKINQYRKWLSGLKKFGRINKLGKSTQNYYLIAVRSFMKYLLAKKLTVFNYNKIKLEKVSRKADFIEKDDLNKLLEAPLKSTLSPIVQARDKAALELLAATGLRVSEISALKKENHVHNLLKFQSGKFDRKIALDNQVEFYLKKYLNLRKDSNPYLFVSHDRAIKGRKNNLEIGLTPRSIERILTRYVELAGIKNLVNPKTLRNTYILALAQSGLTKSELRMLSGRKTVANLD